ncbi:MAG: nitroreductase family protein [Eubacteriaceae bacterium]|nr:nitroreductase family protein [Eubacteriaceae bacterium]
MMEFFDTVMSRRTTRSFEARQIEDKDLDALLLAAHMAPIAGANYAMTHMTVVQDTGLLEEIRFDCGAKPKGQEKYIDSFYGAPTIIFFSANGVSSDYIEYSNIGCAIENILLAATSLGLGSAYIWGCLKKLRKHPETIEKLQLPDGYEILSAVAVGYPIEPLSQRNPADKISVNRI